MLKACVGQNIRMLKKLAPLIKVITRVRPSLRSIISFGNPCGALGVGRGGGCSEALGGLGGLGAHKNAQRRSDKLSSIPGALTFSCSGSNALGTWGWG